MLTRIASAIVFALACALPAFGATPVNINQADAAHIAKALDGIGQAKAQAIVAWRTAHGPFKNVAELTQVKGIGQSLIDRNHGAILLSGASAPLPNHGKHAKAAPKAAPKAG